MKKPMIFETKYRARFSEAGSFGHRQQASGIAWIIFRLNTTLERPACSSVVVERWISTRDVIFSIALSIFGISAGACADENPLEAVRLAKITQSCRWTGDASTTPCQTNLLFAVATTGCTNVKDFGFNIRLFNNTQSIGIVRNAKDRCSGAQSEKQISFETSDLKMGSFFPIVLDNPVLPEGPHYIPGQLLTVERECKP